MTIIDLTYNRLVITINLNVDQYLTVRWLVYLTNENNSCLANRINYKNTVGCNNASHKTSQRAIYSFELFHLKWTRCGSYFLREEITQKHGVPEYMENIQDIQDRHKDNNPNAREKKRAGDAIKVSKAKVFS